MILPAIRPFAQACRGCDTWHAMSRRTRASQLGRRSKDAKIELLSNVPLFSACSKRDLRRIAALADEIDVPEGRVLMRQGEPGQECFVIAEGKAEVRVRGSGSTSLGPGDVVGEMSLLDRGPRSATVTATTDMYLLVLSSRSFSALINQVPLVARRIMAVLAERVREAEARRPLAPHLRSM
jgi:CRP/FNR family transcriptional regulator, cyclic AMP receptor protein